MDQSSKVAAVVARVRGLVHDGTLGADDPLPSTRALAAELGVARGTVVAAYDQLDGEGYIRTRHGAAARVVGGAAAGGSAGVGDGVGVPAGVGAGPVAGAGAAAGAGRASRPVAEPAPGPLLDCRPGIPAVTAISPRDWRAAWRAAAEAPLRNGLSDPLGLPALREQVVVQLGLARGFSPAVSDVVVAAGTSEALSLLVEALRARLGRAPRIAVEDPGYRSGQRALTSAGAELVPVPVASDGIDLAVLAQVSADAVVVSPTHQYPLGSVMPVGHRRALLAQAATAGMVVVEDDYDSEFRHRGAPVPALAALDTDGVVVHLGGFSKTLDPRLRCAYLVLPRSAEPLRTAVVTARAARGPVVAEPVQVAVAHLLRTGAFRRHLGRVRRDYTHRRERIALRLADSGIAGLEARALTGGLHTVLTWAGPATGVGAGAGAGAAAGAMVVARAAAAGVLVADLADYEAERGRSGPGVVLGYGAVTLPELDRALDVVLQAIRGAVVSDPVVSGPVVSGRAVR
ncbi:PLP-dependent aminotransferase family protein [Curtobacterium herbarum]|uniref:PLP-dependent aminotransferase family protein n=1 Tax=Curtobacterium herbarum TaxID=150122 RepID=A0ABN1ZA22_9MICO|nr:PLP-dependent aminotransferase family protein [Curtobacterium herbarum]MBM7475902.1 GntR family transcriptional regulator/MocR family aminotransferase [Curtobacterium herbarum]MCS6544529.1 PLP-dependent aminotransferase family protein [Curtobacterium herbarum]